MYSKSKDFSSVKYSLTSARSGLVYFWDISILSCLVCTFKNFSAIAPLGNKALQVISFR